jgi:hypothetical protein
MRNLLSVSLLAALVLFSVSRDSAQAQEKRSGSLTGEIKSMKDTPNGKNVNLEVLAAGEEKARAYRVQYDPTIKAPKADVLKAVRASKVGDRVSLDWVDTGEGLAITKYEVLKKKTDK